MTTDLPVCALDALAGFPPAVRTVFLGDATVGHPLQDSEPDVGGLRPVRKEAKEQKHEH